MKRKQKEQRMNFIPEIRERIAAGLHYVRRPIIDECFRKWDAGEEPDGMIEATIFECFRDAQRAINDRFSPESKS